MLRPSIDELREMFDADLDAGVLTWRRVSKYHSEKNGKVAGCPRPNHVGKVYWRVRINGFAYARSHLIFAIANGRWPQALVDHINGDSSDDRISNLREATSTENAWNHKKRARRIQLPMGVRNTAAGRYQARLCVDGRMHHLGAYETPEEAAAVYQQKRREYYGAFA